MLVRLEVVVIALGRGGFVVVVGRIYSPFSISKVFFRILMGRRMMGVGGMEREMDVETLPKPMPMFLFSVLKFVLGSVFDVLVFSRMLLLMVEEVDPRSLSMVLVLNLGRNVLRILTLYPSCWD